MHVDGFRERTESETLQKGDSVIAIPDRDVWNQVLGVEPAFVRGRERILMRLAGEPKET